MYLSYLCSTPPPQNDPSAYPFASSVHFEPRYIPEMASSEQKSALGSLRGLSTGCHPPCCYGVTVHVQRTKRAKWFLKGVIK